MSQIKLLTISEYAKNKGVHRTSVWRWLRNGRIDFYVLPHSSKKWLKIDKSLDDILEYKDISLEDQRALEKFAQDNERYEQLLRKGCFDDVDYESLDDSNLS